MPDSENKRSIWLEVANVRRVNDGVEIQVKGDKGDREPVWWEVRSVQAGYGEEGKEAVPEITAADGQAAVPAEPGVPEKPDHNAAYRAIAEGLDKKRIVLANLVPCADAKKPEDGTTLKCASIRIQYAESNTR